MTEYATPKLRGNKVAFNNLVSPLQHQRAWYAANKAGLSIADYVGALIDRDAGAPNLLDDRPQEALMKRSA